MLTMLDPSAAGTMAASSSGSGAVPPWLILVFFGVALVASFVRASSRRKRTRNAPPRGIQSRTVRQDPPIPHGGTLLNGVPMKAYDNAQGQQSMGFANERMRAEAELKRQLDALDAARRAGQVTAEQYAAHREAIFKNF
ncbi:hypothetical protein [Arthrobacter sp. SDTb3-6]|uniref:hypothetical protein n=1 Tax=Arthrobacter sp. SDTb3-6 TaxID=2713571 RepID=UPI00159E7425|nr:hypothetical protein [Arthrobacter sp. SDTb3-6]NVM97647.1 hypothetical protein [Arthrobacter sp. SDTb3-6]